MDDTTNRVSDFNPEANRKTSGPVQSIQPTLDLSWTSPRPVPAQPPEPRQHRVVGLFAGIGGMELGLSRAGHSTQLLCEIEPGAAEVLKTRFPNIEVHPDVTTLRDLPVGTTLIAGGFPCQDLSQAGKTAGIEGSRSGLVGEVFRLLETHRTPWVVLENVPFMLQLSRGRALEVIIEAMEALGYSWAYRVVDTRAFGLPQRRERVFFVATTEGDPRDVLLADDVVPSDTPEHLPGIGFGFYWTEGIRGLGWAVDALPTLKGGSTVGIASPPAVLCPDGLVGMPDVRDGERLQGFPADWTTPALAVSRPGHRWKLVGNAITVDVAHWLGERLRSPGHYDPSRDIPLRRTGQWPRAAWSIDGKRFESKVSSWPVARTRRNLLDFLEHPLKPLSVRAASGFLERASRGGLRFRPGFLDAIRAHRDRVSGTLIDRTDDSVLQLAA